MGSIMLNSKLKALMGRGAYLNFVPVVIETDDINFQPVTDELLGQNVRIRQSIKLFNMVSASLPVSVVNTLSKRLGVKNIYFDSEVPSPSPSPSDMGVQGIVSSTMAKFKETSIRPGKADPGWIPTSKTRQLLGADVARSEGFNGGGVKIAILDTGVPPIGVLRTHPQLSGVGLNATTITGVSQPDSSGHGSHVASTIVGRRYEAPNGMVLEGMAPDSTVLAIKVLETPLGVGRDSDIIKGYEIAHDWGAHLLSMSLGSEGYVPDNPHEGPITKMVGLGHIFVVASGNSGPGASTVGTPGGSPFVFTVASINTQGRVAGFSSRGPVGDRTKPDLASFGGDDVAKESIYSTTARGSEMDLLDKNPFDALAPLMGTSMATPHASGIIALMSNWCLRNLGRFITNKDLWTILQKKGAKNNLTGWGLLKYQDVKVLKP